jgi:hypothetical protein
VWLSHTSVLLPPAAALAEVIPIWALLLGIGHILLAISLGCDHGHFTTWSMVCFQGVGLFNFISSAVPLVELSHEAPQCPCTEPLKSGGSFSPMTFTWRDISKGVMSALSLPLQISVFSVCPYNF